MPAIKEDDDLLDDLILDDLVDQEVAAVSGGSYYPVPKITLARYVARCRNRPEFPFTLDYWQEDLCARLEQAFWCGNARKFKFQEKDSDGFKYVIAPSGFLIPLDEFTEEKNLGINVAIHGPPQFGKTVIISTDYPCWIFGYDPLHRFRLAMYNVYHSAGYSKSIQHRMRSPEHKSIFPDPKGHLPTRTKFVEWSTNARLDLNDGQGSFIAMGLDSGFVGTGADTLVQDDPYRSAEKARSAKVRDTTWRFQTETAQPRLLTHSNNFVMHHRYHNDDQGGRAIASGRFRLWRYAAVADGDYEDETTGRKFPCLPLGRPEGEVLSKREIYPPWYYTDKKNEDLDVWNAQFQGRPTAKEGTFFDVTKIITLSAAEFEQRVMAHEARAWDNAATEKSGDFTAGGRVAIDAMKNLYLRNMKRAQVDTAGRQGLQAIAAQEDGKTIPILFPQDPASAGIDVAFFFRQEYEPEGYTVITQRVTGSKTSRADEFSKVVNAGRFYLVEDHPEGHPNHGRYLTPAQIKEFKSELRDFPAVGLFKDQVDCTADAVTYLVKLFLKGRVIKVNGEYNVLPWTRFVKRFGPRIPGNWEVALACRLGANRSLPSGWALVAHAAQNAKVGEAAFIAASTRKYVNDPNIILSDLKDAVKNYCTRGFDQVQGIYVAHGDAAIIPVALEKFDLALEEFQGDEEKGLNETAWYFQPLKAPNPFYDSQEPQGEGRVATRCYILADDNQVENARDDLGQLSLRQDMLHWSYNDDGKPQPFGGIVLDCVRMTLYNFWLTATVLTKEERRYAQLPAHLQPDALAEKLGTDEYVTNYMAQKIELGRLAQEERRREESESRQGGRFIRPARNPRFKP